MEVEVDPETGIIRLLNYVSAADAGKAINPEQCIGQDEGAVMFGIGHTLMEEMVYEDGQLLNPNLVDYRVPTFKDLPEHSIRFLSKTVTARDRSDRKAWVRADCCPSLRRWLMPFRAPSECESKPFP